MSYNRDLQTFDFANMAFLLMDSFLQKYNMMTPQQCNEIIYFEDDNGKTVIDYLSADKEGIPALTFIINALYDDNFDNICLRQDENKKTLLHRLALITGQGGLLCHIISHLPTKSLAKIITLQDKDKKTILHMPQVLLYIDVLEQFYTYPDVHRAVNTAVLIQDINGYTPYHYMNVLEALLGSNHTFLSLEYHYRKTSTAARAVNDFILKYNSIIEYQPKYEILLQFSTDDTLDKLLSLNDKKGMCFLEYKLSKLYTAVPSKEENTELYSRLANLKSENYSNVIFQVLKKTYLEVKDGRDLKPYGHVFYRILKMCSEIVSVKKEYKFLFKSVKSSSEYYPALIFLLMSCYKPDLKSIKLLFSNIPPEVFFKNYNLMNPVANSFKQRLSDLFMKLKFIPFLEQDPLTTLDTFNLQQLGSNHQWGSTHEMGKYITIFTILHDSAVTIRQHVLEFTLLLSKIVRYHVDHAIHCNPTYSTIIRNGIYAIESRDLQSYPDTNNYFTNCLNQLNLIYAYLSKFQKNEIDINALLDIDPSGIVNSDHCEFAASVCIREVESLPEHDVRKISFELQALRFQHNAAEIVADNIATNTENALAFAEIVPVSDDKNEHKDEEKSSVEVAPEPNSIYNLNVKVYKYLNIVSGVISHKTIDQEKYELALVTMFDHLLSNLDRTYNQHLSEFGKYIVLRENAKPFLFFNAANDFTVRKAYYDILKTNNNSELDLTSKIDTIQSATKSKEIISGRSKRCLAFMNQLNSDLRFYLYLSKVKDTMPQYLAPAEIFRP